MNEIVLFVVPIIPLVTVCDITDGDEVIVCIVLFCIVLYFIIIIPEPPFAPF